MLRLVVCVLAVAAVQATEDLEAVPRFLIGSSTTTLKVFTSTTTTTLKTSIISSTCFISTTSTCAAARRRRGIILEEEAEPVPFLMQEGRSPLVPIEASVFEIEGSQDDTREAIVLGLGDARFNNFAFPTIQNLLTVLFVTTTTGVSTLSTTQTFTTTNSVQLVCSRSGFTYSWCP